LADLSGRDLITTQDWSVEELEHTLRVADRFRAKRQKDGATPLLRDKTFFALFYASSTRTRAAFEAGMTYLGGHAQYIDASTTRLGAGEAVRDVAKMYERYGHGLGVRILDEIIDYVYGRGIAVVREYAKHANIPVINMACCTYHPTQGLADLMTLRDEFGTKKRKKYVIMWAYSKGFRGRCSIQEDALTTSRFGYDVVLAHPEGFEIDPKIIATCSENAAASGGTFTASHDLKTSIEGANAIFPRNWASKGLLEVGAKSFGKEREAELHEKYKHWSLTQETLDLSGKRAIVMHVLPVLRGEEASDEVMDGGRSRIYPQAENGLYTKMAVLALTMGGKKNSR
jgi:ornithine carbamoyltransferase